MDKDKVQLGTRIPKDLNLKIEGVAKHLRLKKQDLIVQLLERGLDTISSLPDFAQRNQPNDTQLSSSLRLPNNFSTDTKNTAVAQP